MAAAKRKGLGKGLDSLIPKIETSEPGTEEAVKPDTFVKISRIEPNKNQPRKKFDEDALQELSESIKQFGVIQPLIVQKRDDYYEIIAGERRWRAAKSRTAVTNSMRLLKLDDRIQQMVIDEMITTGHARALLSIEDKELQHSTAVQVFDEKLSVRETEKLVKKIGKDTPDHLKKEPLKNDFIYRDMEEKIKSIFGTKVSVNHKKNNRGKIEIEYYSNDELERIYDLITSITQN